MKKVVVCLALTAVLGLSGLPLSACSQTQEIRVYMPDGAPAIAMAGVLNSDSENDGVSYFVVKPTLISSKVNFKDQSQNADVCILPLTAAAKLLGSGQNYQTIGTITNGNLYLISNQGVQYSKQNLSALVGETLGVLQLANVPGLTVKAVFAQNGLGDSYATLSGAPLADKINLKGITDGQAGEVEGVNTYLLAEPAATAICTKKASEGYQIVGDLQALYGEGEGYPQAVIVVKNSLLQSRLEWVNSFVQQVRASTDFAFNAAADTLVQLINAHLEDDTSQSTLQAATLSEQVRARLGIGFRAVSQSKAQMQAYLQEVYQIDNSFGIPQEAFYCSIALGE